MSEHEPSSIRLARRISRYGNPIYYFVPAMVAIGYSEFPTPLALGLGELTWLVAVPLVIMTLVPVIYTAILLRRGVISNFYFSDPLERKRFFFPVIIVCFLLSSAVLAVNHAPKLVVALLMSSIINMLFASLLVQRIKLSLHCAGIAALAAGFSLSWGAAGLIFLLPLLPVGWARLRLKQHTLREVVLGSIGGFGGTWLEVWLIRYLWP